MQQREKISNRIEGKILKSASTKKSSPTENECIVFRKFTYCLNTKQSVCKEVLHLYISV